MACFPVWIFIFLFTLQILTQDVRAVSGVKYDRKSMDKWESVHWSYMNTSMWDNYWLFCPSCEKKLESCEEDNNFLLTNFINGSNADALGIKVRFTIKNCRCHDASLSIFAYESDGNTKPEIYKIDEFDYYNIGDVFANSSNIIQEKLVSVPIEKKGLEIGFKSNGGCVVILDIKIYPLYCRGRDNNTGLCLKYAYKGVFMLSISFMNDRVVPLNMVALEGDSVEFSGRAIGFNDSKYRFIWNYNGDLLSKLNDSRHTIINVVSEGPLGQSDLLIKQVKISDSGRYECKAISQYAFYHMDFNLIVKKATKIINAPQNLDLALGEIASFKCSSNNDDSSKLKWLKDGMPIQSENRFNFTQNLLIINKVTIRDSGIYTCMVETDLDWDQASAMLNVQDVPDPPKEVSVECHKDHAYIKWKTGNDNGSPILKYIVQYNASVPINGVWETSRLPQNAIELATIPMLPWRSYSFQVIAQNKIGESKPSNGTSICITREDVPSKNPDNLEVKYIEPNILSVTWTPMTELHHNGKDFYYKIDWKTSIEEEWHYKEVWDWKKNQVQLEVPKLSLGDGYKVKLIAANCKGASTAVATEIFVERMIDEENTSMASALALPVIVILGFLLIFIFCWWKRRMYGHL